MIKFANIADFQTKTLLETSWIRLESALKSFDRVQVEQAHSIGDSVVYVVIPAKSVTAPASDRYFATQIHETNGEELVYLGKRRYRIVLKALSDPINVRVKDKSQLTKIIDYSDLSDEEYFFESGTTKANNLVLDPGQILVLKINEAIAILPPKDSLVGLALITAEAERLRGE